MLRGLRLFQLYSSGRSRSQIEWRESGSTVELILSLPDKRGLIYVISDAVTFKEITSREIFTNTIWKFPKDFNPETTVSHFLAKEQTPLSIELRTGEHVTYLNNRAWEPETTALLRGLGNRKGLLQFVGQKGVDLGQTRSVLTQAYLKLQAEAFCRSSNYTAKSELTPSIREEILNYLCFRNQTNEQEQINALQVDKGSIWSSISQSEAEIRQIQADADKVLRLYQWGAMGVTAFHIVTFGYMIFFVDWLGWDIIEPITFSVGCFYFLLALRFYRRFSRDRNDQTIRDRFRQLVLSPKKLMRLQAAQLNLLQKQAFLKETELKLALSRNRMMQTSTLTTSLLN